MSFKKALRRAFLIVTPIILSIGYLWSVQSPLVASANNEVVYGICFSIFLLFFLKKVFLKKNDLLVLVSVFSILLISFFITSGDLSQLIIVLVYFLNFVSVFLIAKNNSFENKFYISNVLIRSFLFASVVSVFIVIYQYIGLAEYDLNDPFGSLWIHASSGYRPSANLAQPNNLGTLFCLGLIATYALVKDRKQRFLWILLISFGIFITGSRTAILSTLLLCIFLKRKYKFSDAFLSVFLLIALRSFQLLVEVQIFPGQQIETRGVNSGRYLIWIMAIEALIKEPWWGYGPLGAVHAFFEPISRYSKFSEGTVLTSAHNIYLDIFLQFGFFAFVISIIFTFNCFRKFKERSNAWFFFVKLSCLPIFIHALLEMPLYYSFFALPFACLLGVSISSAFSKNYAIRIFPFYIILMVFSFVVINDFYKAELYFKKMRLQINNVEIPNPFKGDESCILENYCNYVKATLLARKNERTFEEDSIILDAAKNFPTPLLYVEKIKIMHRRGMDASKEVNYICNIYKGKVCNEKRVFIDLYKKYN